MNCGPAITPGAAVPAIVVNDPHTWNPPRKPPRRVPMRKDLADRIEQLIAEMPKIVREAQMREVKTAYGAGRRPRVDYACEEMGRVMVERLQQVLTKEPGL
jgi:hypothetical protein